MVNNKVGIVLLSSAGSMCLDIRNTFTQKHMNQLWNITSLFTVFLLNTHNSNHFVFYRK